MSHCSQLPSSTSTRRPVRTLVYGAAAALGLRSSSSAEGPTAGDLPSSPATQLPDGVVDGELTTQLARLHDDHVERVNSAVGEGREDLLQGLSDSYVEQAMALMSRAGLPPVDAAHRLGA